MRVTITQLRKYRADASYPQFIHTGYSTEEHCGEMFTSEPGYDIAAVYIMPDLPDANGNMPQSDNDIPDVPQGIMPDAHADIDRMAFFYGYLAHANRALYAEIEKAWDDSK